MKKAFLIILLLLFVAPIFAQQDSLVVKTDKNSPIELKKFDQENLNEYKADEEFDYTVYKPKETIFSKIWEWIKRMLMKFLSWIFGVERASNILLMIIGALPYIILLVVLIILLKLFLKVKTSSLRTGKTEQAKVFMTEDEEIINNKNIQELIDAAIKQGNFRLAVRYYYLQALQKLQEKELIDWQQQKTNEDYLKEIKQQSISEKFSNLTYLYDFVWYGNFEINETEFGQVAAKFDALKTSIK